MGVEKIIAESWRDGFFRVDPEVLQSGVGLSFYFGLAKFRKLSAYFSVNSLAGFSRKMFGLVSPGFEGPP